MHQSKVHANGWMNPTTHGKFHRERKHLRDWQCCFSLCPFWDRVATHGLGTTIITEVILHLMEMLWLGKTLPASNPSLLLQLGFPSKQKHFRRSADFLFAFSDKELILR